MEKKKSAEGEGKKLAVIRVRGQIHVRHDMKCTLTMLKLYRPNYCVILDATDSNVGMVKKAKDYITWGEVSAETLDMLKKKAPLEPKSNLVVYNLHPPRGGYGRKGVKVAFVNKGALGYRGEKINDLILKML